MCIYTSIFGLPILFDKPWQSALSGDTYVFGIGELNVLNLLG